ncbi:MAG: VCBS repeat-containing protein [Chloroflexi bacterium]|nr:VCBS repeat-containing protein [Chloroflexota bacterium]
MHGRPNPRRRRIVWTLLGSGAFIALTIGLVLLRRPEAAPYLPGEAVEGITDSLGRALPAGHPEPRFEDVTAAAGIDFHHFEGRRSSQLPEDMGSGAAWGDYDGDGWLDLYLANLAGAIGPTAEALQDATARGQLYHNRRDGRFEPVGEQLGLSPAEYGMAAAWADFDADGDLDLATSAFGGLALYRNDGVAGFVEVGASAGLSAADGFWTGLAWADYDRDGDLDLYVCGYVQYRYDPDAAGRMSEQYGSETPATLNPSSYPPERNLLFDNAGDGRFVERAAAAGIDNPDGRSLSAVWSDFDEDGWPDLYVANDVSDNALYHNEGDGVFRDVSLEAWVADYRGAMGLASGDWDGDRDLDLFVTHWIAQENALYENQVGPAPASLALEPGAVAAADRPAPRFNDQADRYGLGQIALDFIGWGTGFLDFDLDGRLDLAVVNGSTFQDPADSSRLIGMADQLFWNAGADGYFDLSEIAGPALAQPRVSRGLAIADYDNDGDEDLLVVDFDAPPRLLNNASRSGHHWLKLRLRAADSGNRAGIGARITLEAGGRAQLREMSGGGSYLSQHAAEAVFGLGEAESVDALDLRWPDGSVQSLIDLPVGAILQVEQGAGWTVWEPAAPSGPPSGAGGGSASPTLDREQTLRFWALYREAVRSMKQSGDWTAAAAGFEAALALDPRHEESLYNLGNCLVELGEPAAALTRFEQLVALNPQSLRGRLQIGNLRASPVAGPLFDLDAAAEAYASAVALNPEESGALLQLGAVELARGHAAEAEEHLMLARRFNPKAVEAFYLGGYLAWRRAEVDAAGRLLAEAIRLAATEPPVEAVPGEGATASGSAMLVEGAAERRLFGARLARLAERDPAAELGAAALDREYDGLAAEIDALPR